MNRYLASFGFFLALFAKISAQDFSYLPLVQEGTVHLTLFVEKVDNQSGQVHINGSDTRQPNVPFLWNFGDGTVILGWFPQDHTYNDKSRNYVVTVSSDGESASTLILFRAPEYVPVELPNRSLVMVETKERTLISRWYDPVETRRFNPEDFGVLNRECVQHVASAMANIQLEYTNNKVWFCDNQSFNQIIYKAGTSGGYSTWYTSPPSFAVGSDAFRNQVWWNTLSHEMGHNISLNFPSAYHIGGRIDGSANAIYSETMAQILGLCTGYDLVNQAKQFGLSDDLAYLLRGEFNNGFRIVRDGYRSYIQNLAPFVSWNDPSTLADETFGVFMILAFEFIKWAEQSDEKVSWYVTRLMDFFSYFDKNWEFQYDRSSNSQEGNSFRSTLMVAAFSFSFKEDLRDHYRALNFPIDDKVYLDLMNQVTTGSEGLKVWSGISVYPNPTSDFIIISGLPRGTEVKVNIQDLTGREMISMIATEPSKPLSIDFTGFKAGIYVVGIYESERILRFFQIIKE
jgi:hypothetical protein